jgi:hypothetical protein
MCTVADAAQNKDCVAAEAEILRLVIQDATSVPLNAGHIFVCKALSLEFA